MTGQIQLFWIFLYYLSTGANGDIVGYSTFAAGNAERILLPTIPTSNKVDDVQVFTHTPAVERIYMENITIKTTRLSQPPIDFTFSTPVTIISTKSPAGDECRDKTICKNGGVCQNVFAGYCCRCDSKHYGPNCERMRPNITSAPRINRISRNKGLLTGGGELEFTGNNFDDFPPCTITFEPVDTTLWTLYGPIKYKSPTKFVVVAPEAPSNSESYVGKEFKINVTFVDGSFDATGLFGFVENPNITDITPRNPLITPYGGVSLTVTGDNLDVITNAIMTANFTVTNTTNNVLFQSINQSICVPSNYTLLCPMPNFHIPVTAEWMNLTEANKTISVSFILDQYKQQLPPQLGDLHPVLVPPLIISSNEMLIIRPQNRENINIKGKKMDVGCSKNDYTIEIGNGYCSVKLLRSNNLECLPPQELPLAGNTKATPCDGRGGLAILARIAGETQFVQCAKYEYNSADLGLIIGLSVTGAILILIAAIGLTYFVSKKRRSRRSTPSSSVIPSKAYGSLSSGIVNPRLSSYEKNLMSMKDGQMTSDTETLRQRPHGRSHVPSYLEASNGESTHAGRISYINNSEMNSSHPSYLAVVDDRSNNYMGGEEAI